MNTVARLAELAKEDVPESVAHAYGEEAFRFGAKYLIPKPFDPRVLLWVAPAVATLGLGVMIAFVALLALGRIDAASSLRDAAVGAGVTFLPRTTVDDLLELEKPPQLIPDDLLSPRSPLGSRD